MQSASATRSPLVHSTLTMSDVGTNAGYISESEILYARTVVENVTIENSNTVE